MGKEIRTTEPHVYSSTSTAPPTTFSLFSQTATKAPTKPSWRWRRYWGGNLIRYVGFSFTNKLKDRFLWQRKQDHKQFVDAVARLRIKNGYAYGEEIIWIKIAIENSGVFLSIYKWHWKWFSRVQQYMHFFYFFWETFEIDSQIAQQLKGSSSDHWKRFHWEHYMGNYQMHGKHVHLMNTWKMEMFNKWWLVQDHLGGILNLKHV